MLAYARSVLGPVNIAASYLRRVSHILQVADAGGRMWVLKTVPNRVAFRNEVRAYTEWVPALDDHAPALKHVNTQLGTLILSRLPGVTGWTYSPEHHAEAGRLLARLHGSSPPRDGGPSIADRAHEKLQRILARAPRDRPFTDPDLAFVTAAASELHDFAHLRRVPCHGDYGGHNWLHDGSRIAVVDFGAAGWNAAAADFARLFIGTGWEHPDLCAAFFSGYGRPPAADEMRAVQLLLPVHALALICRGRTRGNAEMERRGRHRLDKLMERHDFTRRAPWIRRQARRLHIRPRIDGRGI